MADRLPIERFLDCARTTPVVDVRTPSEFRQGHIPRAINLPLFSDEERARVGTLYRHEGRSEAMLAGLDLVGPKMRMLVERAEEQLPEARALVHCWRGGMRSEAVAWLLSFFGIETTTLEGGYKSFRRFVAAAFGEQRRLLVIGGMTGCGKTEVLQAMRAHGELVIDLEAIACHRGSVFGHLGMDNQPTQEQFENDLAMEWRATDPDRPVWVEDESRRIGRVVLPTAIYDAKSRAPTFFLRRDRRERVAYLVSEYGRFGRERLVEAVVSIARKLGGERTRTTVSLIEHGDLAAACDLLLEYYDAAYEHALNRRGIDAVDIDLPPGYRTDEAARRLIDHTSTFST